jgi:2,3-bisphosphoglycerate-dependent phosphoglycerate mutase
MRLVLIRHGESTANAEGRLQGRADFPLSDRGRREAACLAERLPPFELSALYSSPLSRARETAEIVSAGVGLSVVEQDDLAEYDFGPLGGLTREQIREQYPDFVRAQAEGRRGEGVPGLEPYEDFAARVARVMDEIIASHVDGRVAVVTHGGVLGIFTRIALGLPFERPGMVVFGNCSITQFEVGETRPGRGRFQLVTLNDLCHLGDVSLEHEIETSTDQEAAGQG